MKYLNEVIKELKPYDTVVNEDVRQEAEDAMEDALEAIVKDGKHEPTKEEVMHYLTTKLNVSKAVYNMAHDLQFGDHRTPEQKDKDDKFDAKTLASLKSMSLKEDFKPKLDQSMKQIRSEIISAYEHMLDEFVDRGADEEVIKGQIFVHVRQEVSKLLRDLEKEIK